MVVNNGTNIDEKDIIYITEMLMRQLLELDKVEAAGEGKMQRKMEVCFQCHLVLHFTISTNSCLCRWLTSIVKCLLRCSFSFSLTLYLFASLELEIEFLFNKHSPFSF